MAEQSAIHKGHRKRLKERFLAEGLDNFDEVNVLELMLFYCVQRQCRIQQSGGKGEHCRETPDGNQKLLQGFWHSGGTYCVFKLFRF